MREVLPVVGLCVLLDINLMLVVVSVMFIIKAWRRSPL